MIIVLLKIMFNFILTMVSFLVPKSRKYVIVGGWEGKRYADNSRGMYEYLYVHKNQLGINRVFWHTKEKEIYNKLKKEKKDVLFGYDFHSIYWHLRSKVHIIDQNPRDIIGILSVRCIRINLWHGFPLKKIGNYMEMEKRKSCWYKKYASAGFWQNSYLLSTSEFAKEILSYAMGIKKEKCLVASYPRTEKLYYCKSIVKNRDQIFNIFYLPTFRDTNSINPILAADLVSIDKKFRELNIMFYIKPHFASMAQWKAAGKFTNIKILEAKEDVYNWLDKTDLLITDYSSVFFDFLLTGRAILFYPYDYENYKKKERGFTIPYNNFTPGKKVYTVKGLMQHIVQIRENYEGYQQIYKKQYIWVNNKVNKYKKQADYSDILKFWQKC